MNKKIIISKLEEVLKAQLIIGNEEIRVLSLTDSLVKLKKNNVGFFFFLICTIGSGLSRYQMKGLLFFLLTPPKLGFGAGLAPDGAAFGWGELVVPASTS